MSYNYNFEDESIQTFDHLKGALKERFDDLFSKGYLYKGDMGETPQIVNRPLVKEGKWTILGKSVIGEIFKDSKNEKYKEYYKEGIDTLISELTKDGKLDGLDGATYPWWCADGNSEHPIYPATYFVYVDSTPNNIRNDDNRWKANSHGKWEDDSCILIPANVEYNDYRDGIPEEEREPIITYQKNHIYPTFYFDSNAKGASAGAWCWEINGVQTGVPASVANDDGSVLGHMFIFKNDNGVYKYKTGVDAVNGWMTREEMIKKEIRYPINGDIGFTIEKVKETGDNPTTTETTGGDSATIANINTLQIYNFVENNDKVNGGAWGRGGNLISFGESFYKALWEFISGDSGVEINKGKIILGTTNGNHCIFVKSDVNKTGQTLVLMPLPSTIDPTSKEDFNDDETWSEAKLQLNYPETTINGAVIIKSNLDVSDKNIKVGSIDATEDISCKSIKASSDIHTESSISCNEITANNFIANDDEIIIGSDTTRVNVISPNFKVTNNFVDTNLPFTSSNIIKISDTKTPEEYIKIYADKTIDAVRKELGQATTETKSTTTTIISGGGSDGGTISSTGSYNGQGKGTQICNVTVAYKSKEYDLPEKMDSITLSMPSSLGITINVKGKINYGSWPLLKGGLMTLKIIAKTTTGEDKVICTNDAVIIGGNNSSGFSKKEETKWCTIYCSFTSKQLNDASLDLINFKNNYKSIYITAEATFNLGVDIGTLNKPHDAIYEAGTICYLYPYTRNSSGGSIWTSSIPSGLLYDIFNISTTELISTDSGNTTTVSICRDGILIGRASNKSAVLYIDKAGGFHIDYYRPKADANGDLAVFDIKKILSIDTSGSCYSDVFQLKQSTTASSTES